MTSNFKSCVSENNLQWDGLTQIPHDQHHPLSSTTIIAIIPNTA